MGNKTVKLALELTAIDLGSRILDAFKNKILGINSASDKVRASYDRMLSDFKSGAKALSTTKFLGGMLLQGIKESADLEESLLYIKANLADSVTPAAKLNSQLEQLYRTGTKMSSDMFRFKPQEILEAQKELVKALGSSQIKDILAPKGLTYASVAVARLSQGEMTPGEVGETLARIGDQFALRGEQYQQVADWMVRVEKGTPVNLREIINAMRMAGAEAAKLKIDPREFISSIGALSSIGRGGSGMMMQGGIGVSLSNFLLAIQGTTKENMQIMKFMQRKYGLEPFYIGEGREKRFIGLTAAIKNLNKAFGQIEDTEKRNIILARLFGEQGGRAANTFLNSARSIERVNEEAQKSLSLEEQVNILAEGLNDKFDRLKNTGETITDKLFKPMMEDSKKIVDFFSELGSKVDNTLKDNPKLAKGFTRLTEGAMLSLGTYGAFKFLQGGIRGVRLWQGLKNTGADLAMGKIVEKTVGVTPVWVTNWPIAMTGGIPGGAFNDKIRTTVLENIGGGVAAGTAAGTAVGKLGLLGKGGLVLSAAGGGYLAGNFLEEMVRSKAQDNDLTGRISSQVDRYWEGLANVIYKLFYSEIAVSGLSQKSKERIENKINLTVNIDRQGRMSSDSDDTNTFITSNGGKFFPD